MGDAMGIKAAPEAKEDAAEQPGEEESTLADYKANAGYAKHMKVRTSCNRYDQVMAPLLLRHIYQVPERATEDVDGCNCDLRVTGTKARRYRC